MGKDLKGRNIGKGITQRKDGRYMGRVQVNGEILTLYNTNLNELKKELDKAKETVALKALNQCIPANLTLDEWWEEWFTNYKEPTLKGTGTSYRRQYANYYGCRIGDKHLRDIRQIDIQMAIAEMLKAGRTSKSVREATGILRQCIEAAIANGYMSLNPVIGTQIPASTTAKRRVLSAEEQQEFIEYLESVKSWYTEIYKFMLVSGCRAGEIGALRWSDIDFNAERIYITQSLMCQYENGVKTEKLTSPKTENSVRSIPFFGETREILEHWKAKVDARKELLGERWRLPEEYGDLVFVTSMGSVMSRYNLESDLRYVTEQINLIRKDESRRNGTEYKEMERIHPHCLRHTFATRAFEHGMTARCVQEIMGHSNYNTTVSYTHVLEYVKNQEALEVGNFLDCKKPDTVTRKTVYENLIGVM